LYAFGPGNAAGRETDWGARLMPVPIGAWRGNAYGEIDQMIPPFDQSGVLPYFNEFVGVIFGTDRAGTPKGVIEVIL